MELPSKIPRISPATSTSDDDLTYYLVKKRVNTAQNK